MGKSGKKWDAPTLKSVVRTAIFGGNRKWGRRLLQTLSRQADTPRFKEVC
jgi:hypothetical protein